MEGLKFWRPRSVEEAAELMFREKSVPLAGGTDLVIEIKKRRCSAENVVDLTAITELAQVERSEQNLEIGALVTFSSLASSPAVKEFCPVLAEAALSVGSPQIRNRGTVGGNIMSGSPAADIVPPLVALDAYAVLVSSAGERKLKLIELLGSPGKPVLKRGEFLKKVCFPFPKKGCRWAFAKLGRRNALAISRISMVLMADTTGTGEITAASLALGAVAPHPVRVPVVENLLAGMSEASNFEPVAALLGTVVGELLGQRPSVVYKKEAIKGVAWEVWNKMWQIRLS
jgi:CO/xanthine dehydrogenase FAD-binding subunit